MGAKNKIKINLILFFPSMFKGKNKKKVFLV
jgi:hypothetical protein